jgi:5-methylcytosine-specific restriction endonuclease McrA
MDLPKTNLQRIYERKALGFNDKARALGARGLITAEDLARKPLECFYCEVGLAQGNSEFDHQIAFDRGGVNEPENIVRCCKDCNNRKFTKTPEEFKAYLDARWECPQCGKQYRPRYADWKRGHGTVCSRACSGRRRWRVGR